MKLSLEQLLELVALYKQYKSGALPLAQAVSQGIDILTAAGVTLADVGTLVKEIGPLLPALGVKA